MKQTKENKTEIEIVEEVYANLIVEAISDVISYKRLNELYVLMNLVDLVTDSNAETLENIMKIARAELLERAKGPYNTEDQLEANLIEEITRLEYYI